MVEDIPNRRDAAAIQPWARTLWRGMSALMTFAALLWNVDFLEWFGFAFVQEQYYAFILALSLAVVFLSVRINRAEEGHVPWYDLILAAISMVVLLYISVNFLHLREFGLAESTPLAIALGAIVMVLVIDGLRRSAGYIMLIIALVFIAYAMIGHMVPGPLVGTEVKLWQLAINMGFNPNALFGIPLQVGTTIVIMLILFGQLLMKAGGGAFFTDLAMATVGRRRGGAAKVSVVASALFGTVSGTAVSNVVTKALAQNKKHLAKSMGAFNRLKPETFGEPTMAPYHPGALRALKELGIKIGK
jgi:TRAP-type uncharacterized transport system fused permease subunit